MTSAPKQNRQAGIPIPSSAAEEPHVAHGSRRDEAHYEADPEQLVAVKFNVKPQDPLPPEEQSAALEDGSGLSDAPPIQDVAVSTSEDSVWDARPPPDTEERSGNPTGH